MMSNDCDIYKMCTFKSSNGETNRRVMKTFKFNISCILFEKLSEMNNPLGFQFSSFMNYTFSLISKIHLYVPDVHAIFEMLKYIIY